MTGLVQATPVDALFVYQELFAFRKLARVHIVVNMPSCTTCERDQRATAVVAFAPRARHVARTHAHQCTNRLSSAVYSGVDG